MEIHPHEVHCGEGTPLFPSVQEEGRSSNPPPPPRPQSTHLRFAESPAASRQRQAKDASRLQHQHSGHSHGPAGECLPTSGTDPTTTDHQLSSSGNNLGSTTDAWTALRAGVGASSWKLSKPPRIRAALADVVFDMASQAQAHLDHARAMSPRLPQASRAALLPAVPLQAFLSRLEQQQFDVFSVGGLGPWADGRPYARISLQSALIYHTLRNSY